MSNRTLGTIAMVCAPAILLLRQGSDDPVTTGLAGTVFMLGWICSNIGMQRVRAAGTGAWGRAVLLIQLVGLVLAFSFGILEATGLLKGTTVFTVTDVAWPLSMLWMLVVGVSVLVAKRLRGWRRAVPVLCPFWLPIGIAGQSTLGVVGDLAGLVFAMVLWVLLGYTARGDEPQTAVGHEPAVQ